VVNHIALRGAFRKLVPALNDLASQQPQRVQTMAKVFEEWQRTGEAK
jgi:hypothetical protein